MVFRRIIHGGDGAGGAVLLCGPGNEVLRHEAVRRPAEFFEPRTADTGKGHVGIGHDLRAAPQSLHRLLDSAGGEAQVFGVVKVGACVDAAHDHGGVLRRERDPPRFEFFRDDGHAAALNIGRKCFHRHTPP